MFNYTVSLVRSWETTLLTHQNKEVTHNFLDTIPHKPFPQRLNCKNYQVIRRDLSHQWTYLLFPSYCELNGMTEQRQRGVQSMFNV